MKIKHLYDSWAVTIWGAIKRTTLLFTVGGLIALIFILANYNHIVWAFILLFIATVAAFIWVDRM